MWSSAVIMNHTIPSSHCGVTTYLDFCAFSKMALLVPGLVLNGLVLTSLASSVLGKRRSPIRRNVALFIFGTTVCNLLSLLFWPLTFHWKTHGRWLLGARLCELMVGMKHVTNSASFYYLFFISLSVYLTVVAGCGQLVNSKLFLAPQLLLPFLPVLVKELCQRVLEGTVRHMDSVDLTCFSYINDQAMQVLMLIKVVVFLPLNLYIYAHILVTIFRSAQHMCRSQAVNIKLAKMFGVISLITLLAHLPVVLLGMNTELQAQCLALLKRRMAGHGHSSSQSSTASEEQSKFLSTDLTIESHV